MFATKTYRIFLVLSALLLVLSCTKKGCFKGYGEEILEERTISPFKILNIYHNIETHYYYDTTFHVKIKYGSNLIPNISTEVRDGTLELKNLNKCNWMRDFRKFPVVEVYAPYFYRLNSYSSKDFICEDTLDLRNVPPYEDTLYLFQTRIQRSGDIKLKIITKNSYVKNILEDTGNLTLEGDLVLVETTLGFTGNYYALNANVAFNYIAHQGLGDAYLYSYKGLEVRLTGKGNVYKKGKPRWYERLYDQGEGKIISLD